MIQIQHQAVIARKKAPIADEPYLAWEEDIELEEDVEWEEDI